MSDAIRTILRRIPGWAQILPVYGVIVLIIYSWTLLWFFWKLPAWLYYLNLGDILMVLAYSLATNFAESVALLCAPLLLALALPRRWFHDVFVARGAALAIAGLGYLMFLAYQFKEKSAYPTFSLQAWTILLAAAIIAGVIYLFGRIAVLRNALEVIADRMTIFPYFLAPLSIVSVLVILVRALVG